MTYTFSTRKQSILQYHHPSRHSTLISTLASVLFLLLLVQAWAIIPTQTAEYLGSGKGVRFRVFAPHASSVAVAGDWNYWSATANPLTKGAGDVWWTVVPDADHYQQYKYVINGDRWQKDPNSLMVQNSGWGANSIIADLGHYVWSHNEANWQSGAHLPVITEMVIYQIHLKSFMFRNDGVPYQYGNMFNLFVEHKLDYLKELGINCIMLMPIHEFPGDQSWGYNPAFWFAVESAYGTPYDFQHFIDECHKHGIAVLLDVVYNHAGPDDIPHYWDFDGGWVHDVGGNGNYFYTDWRGPTPWGNTNPNFSWNRVRDMLVENAKMWILDYHVDGLRVDSTVTIRKDKDDGWDWDGVDNPDGWSFLQYLNNELRPLKGWRTVTIAEDIAGNSWITKNTSESGAGFTAQWQPSPIVNVVSEWDDNNRDMNEVAQALGYTIGVNYGVHEIVKYHSSHDTTDARNGHWRLPNCIGDPSAWYTKKRTKLAQAIIVTAPGTPMIFMGDEFYATGQWDDDPDHALDWAQLDAHSDIWEFNRALIRLKRNHGAMHTNSFEIPVVDNDMKIVVHKRWDDYGDVLIFVTNFRAIEQTRGIPFPEDGTWYEILNSDAAAYGGDNVGNGGSVNVSSGWANCRIGSYSMIVFARQPDRYPPARVKSPNPPDGAINTAQDLTLTWHTASEASSYNVFFGTDRTAVENAGDTSPEWKGNQTATEYHISGLAAFTDYYWRIDSLNQYGVTKGVVWKFTTGNGNSGSEGRAVWTPKKPIAGSPITIRYYAEGGPLGGASTMYLHWGYNNWQEVTDTQMTSAGDNVWSLTFDVPSLASTLAFVFTTDPSGGNWDNNNGADWHVNVLGAPPVAEWSPEPPVENQQMTITYHADRGTLGGAAQIYIHRGFNNWAAQTIVHLLMEHASGQDWTHIFTVPVGVSQVDFVFADGPGGEGTNWDNNNGLNWHVEVLGGQTPAWGISTNTLQPITYEKSDAPNWGFDIWNAGQGTLNWSLSKQDDGSGTDWFSSSPTSGTSTGVGDRTTVTITFDTDTLGTGTYTGRIVATDEDHLISDATIYIMLTVQPLNHIIVTPAILSVDWPATGTATPTFTLRNGVSGTMPFRVNVREPETHVWMSVSPISGTNYGPPTTIQVELNPQGLTKQKYTAYLDVNGSHCDNSPVTVQVNLEPIEGRNGWLLH